LFAGGGYFCGDGLGVASSERPIGAFYTHVEGVVLAAFGYFYATAWFTGAWPPL